MLIVGMSDCSDACLHVVVLTGAGISAESGLKTFRGADGLWENHRVEDVATPEAWERDRELVLRFYNERRAQLYEVEPNDGHRALAELERTHRVSIVTQNIDNLHERAGSTSVLHLHGELDFARSTVDERLLYPLEGGAIGIGDRCERGSQLRPHVVWFGEAVPELERAAGLVATADVLIVVGTSLRVYPAANLAYMAPEGAKKFVVDLEIPDADGLADFDCREKPASVGLREVVAELR